MRWPTNWKDGLLYIGLPVLAAVTLIVAIVLVVLWATQDSTTWGCTDPAATNYDPSATGNDGTCAYDGSGGGTDGSGGGTDGSGGGTDGSGGGGAISGCTNPVALNYDASATLDDGSCIIVGCTDPSADNYDPDATQDASCAYLGCTDPSASNYQSWANVDASCIYVGCTDPAALNYDAQANTPDDSCVYGVLGCTDPNSVAYDPTATVDDGTCNTQFGNVRCTFTTPDGSAHTTTGLPDAATACQAAVQWVYASGYTDGFASAYAGLDDDDQCSLFFVRDTCASGGFWTDASSGGILLTTGACA